MKKHITKYDYIAFRNCPYSFACSWFAFPTKESGHNSVKDFLTAQGREVGLLAQELFKGRNGISFEKKFSYEDLAIRADVFDGQGNELIEIKSTTEVKEEHLIDAAFQKYVCEKCGVKVDKVKIAHIIKYYIREEGLNFNELFIIEDASALVVPIISELEKDLPVIRKIIESRAFPLKSIGRQCFADGGCPYQENCLGENVSDTIFTLRRDGKGKMFDLHKEGVRCLKDIPYSVTLTKFQSLQKEAEIQNCAMVNQPALAVAISEIVYPIFFLDFESCNPAIPRFNKTSPFQHIPFQASIHLF